MSGTPQPSAPTLTDGTVTLRAHTAADAAGSFEQCQDPLSQEWTAVPLPYTREMAVDFVTVTMPQGWADDSEWGFAIEVGGRYGGTVSLRNEGAGRAEIAYGSHPWIRGGGLVERALRLLLEWGFEARGLHTVVWWANQGNWASRRVAWRLGFCLDGSVRAWLPQRGELRDAWVATLRRDDPREPRSTWYDRPVLESDGVRLRPMVLSDVPRIVETGRDPRTQQYLGFMFPLPWTEDDASAVVRSGLEGAAAGRGVNWAIADGDDVLAGWLALFGIRPGRSAELGYWAHPSARGHGLVTRAIALAEQHARDTLGLPVLLAKAAVGNAASRHVLEANGFEHTGVEHRGTVVDDAPADLATYDKVLVA